MKKQKILFIDDDESLLQIARYNLENSGYEVICARDGEQGLELFMTQRPDVVVTDLVMPKLDGLALIPKIKSIDEDAVIIVITAHGSIESAIDAMKFGAYDYLQKPFSGDELIAAVKRSLVVVDLRKETKYLRYVTQEKYRFESIIGTSKKMREIYQIAGQVAQRDTTVMILGESGTGKELLAKAIHFNSKRKDKPFIAVNVGAIPKDLVDSELFGHEKGSFTGAFASKQGHFELADGGTLFLDEIAEMQLEHQVRLLRALQEREIQKVGGTKTVSVNVRIIAATNQDLEAKVKDGEFREDLFYRLFVVPIKLPPLRERRDDIPLLLDHFLIKYCKEAEIHKLKVEDKALRTLMDYSWPGNVRELENFVERAAAITTSDAIFFDDLPEKVRRPYATTGRIFLDLPDEGIALDDIEKSVIERALEKNNYNQTKTAQFLRITRNMLVYRLEKLNITKKV